MKFSINSIVPYSGVHKDKNIFYVYRFDKGKYVYITRKHEIVGWNEKRYDNGEMSFYSREEAQAAIDAVTGDKKCIDVFNPKTGENLSIAIKYIVSTPEEKITCQDMQEVAKVIEDKFLNKNVIVEKKYVVI